MPTPPLWTRCLDFLSASTLLTVVLCAMPAVGLLSAFNGLREGPNHYASRTVQVEGVHVESRTTRNSGRFGGDETRESAWVSWQFTDHLGQTRQGVSKVHPSHLPAKGSQASLLIDVEPGEGRFMLNLKVEQGLAVFLVFGAMAWCVAFMTRGRGQPGARQGPGFQVGLALGAGLMAAVVVVLLAVPCVSGSW